jgi:signal transduction histidine kinase
LAGALSAVRDPATISRLVQQANAGNPRPITVFLPDGRILGAPAPITPNVELARQGRAFTATGPHGSRIILVGVRGPDGRWTVVQVLVAGALLTRGVSRAWVVLAALGAGMLIIALGVAEAMARSIVAPIDQLVTVAGRLQEGDLAARVVPGGPPEVAAVGVAVNELAERIGDLLAAEREATADLSHQLRTPLTALRLDAESLRRADERRRITTSVESIERAVNHVIHEARSAPMIRPHSAPPEADLADAVRRRMTFWAVLADKQSRPLAVDAGADRHRVAVRPEELDIVIDALVANVFGHTPEGTALAVRVRHAGPKQMLVVEDDGPGLPGNRLPKRGTSKSGGTGLGLDIVRRAAEASGGQVKVGRSPSGGARIEVIFGSPAAA